jgi:hypothetical protein
MLPIALLIRTVTSALTRNMFLALLGIGQLRPRPLYAADCGRSFQHDAPSKTTCSC